MSEHGENIAELLSESELSVIASDLLAGIEEDERSRHELLGDLARGLDILAVRLESPRSDAGSSAAPMEGMSNARHPLALEAALRFRANFLGEFLPADGPVKIENVGDENPMMQELADRLEKAMNTYLRVTATEYYPDTDKMGFGVGWNGCGFKKGYHCPIRRRPVIESVPLKDLIINNSATDLQNADRITQVCRMSLQTLIRMRIAKAYRDVDLLRPQDANTILDSKEQRLQGIDPNTTRAEDTKYSIYECYCYLDIKGFEHIDEDGEVTGLPLPYKVSIDKTTRTILEIRRDWKEDDQECLRKRTYIMYPFEPMFGFYPFGLLKLLGNTTNSLTAAWRILLDAGMFGNFPGWLHPKTGDKQLNNSFRCAPGSGVAVEVPPGSNLRDSFVPLPYKTPDPVFVQLVSNIEGAGQRLAGTTELQVGEGRQDAPVGSTLAMIEQATRMLIAVHKRLHIAQSQEFQMLRELFLEDPSALWRHNKRIAPWDEQVLLMALDNMELIPAADPNIPSRLHRMMQAQTLKSVAASAPPGMYDMHKVDAYVLKTAHISQPEQFFAPPPPPVPAQQAPDPLMASVLQKEESDKRDLQFKLIKLETDAEQKEADRRAKMEVEKLKTMREIATHPAAMEQT